MSWSDAIRGHIAGSAHQCAAKHIVPACGSCSGQPRHRRTGAHDELIEQHELIEQRHRRLRRVGEWLLREKRQATECRLERRRQPLLERCDGRELRAPGPVTEECRAVWAEREAADVDP